MHYLFEESDYLNTPVECFYYSAADEDFPVRPHWHYFMEIIYVMKGTAEMYDGDNCYAMKSGDMIIFHPKSVHSIYSSDPHTLEYAVMKFDINRLNMTSSYAPKFRSIFRSAEKKGMNVFFSAQEAKGVGEIFRQCIDEMQTQKYGFDLIIQTRIYELLLRVIRMWQDHGFCVDSSTFEDDSKYDIFNITEYIDRHMSDGLKISEIAKECGMSYSYFAKKFLSVYGQTCKEYIESMRLFKVEEFLIFTDFDLNYISQETGYSDCSHMIKSFKRKKGITPKQFRMQRSENVLKR